MCSSLWKTVVAKIELFIYVGFSVNVNPHQGTKRRYNIFLSRRESYSSIGDLVTHSLTDWLSHFWFWHTKSRPREMWPLRHLFRVMRRHNMTKIYKNPFFFWKMPKILENFKFFEHLKISESAKNNFFKCKNFQKSNSFQKSKNLQNV